MPKPPSIEQKVLIGLVVGFVQNFVPECSPADLIWVRALKASKFAVLNVQCKSVVMATRVKSTFASIVKAAVKPPILETCQSRLLILWEQESGCL